VKAHAISLGTRAAHPVRDAALWLALLVALASSLLSSGFPRTTALGSAFNPATTSVVLRPIRPAPRIMAEVPRRDDGPAAGARDATIVAPAVELALQPGATRQPDIARASVLPLRPHPVLDGSPRGPPLS
jgi:hypothetical protein